MHFLKREIYPEEIFDILFNFKDRDAYDQYFEYVGYEKTVFIPGLGSEFINICLLILGVIVTTLATKISVCMYRKKRF